MLFAPAALFAAASVLNGARASPVPSAGLGVVDVPDHRADRDRDRRGRGLGVWVVAVGDGVGEAVGAGEAGFGV